MSGWRPAYVGDRIRLGRMLQVNGSFNSFDSGFPTWWTKYDQTSYFQSTAFPHSGPLSMQVVCNSQAVASTMLQHPAKRYATWSAYQTEPVDYFLDGQTHTIKFAAWLNPAGVSSGSFRLVMVASGVNAYSTWLSSGADWNWLETAANTFTGSNGMYAGLTRDANETAGTIFIAESAIILDELELEVSAAAEFRGTPGHYSERTDRGYARHHLYEAPAFRLPLIGVDSRGRSLLESWHVMGAPLILRFDASSGGTPVFSLGLVGKETAFASVGVDTAYRDGVITLEAL